MAYTVIIESFKEFTQRHGDDGLLIDEIGAIVFSDGASVAFDDADRRDEPPDNPKSLLELKRLYHREATKRAEQDFYGTRKQFVDMAAAAARYANPLPGPPADAVQILAELAEHARQCRAQLADIDRQLKEMAPPEDKQARAYQERRQREHRANAELLHQIQFVNL